MGKYLFASYQNPNSASNGYNYVFRTADLSTAYSGSSGYLPIRSTDGTNYFGGGLWGTGGGGSSVGTFGKFDNRLNLLYYRDNPDNREITTLCSNSNYVYPLSVTHLYKYNTAFTYITGKTTSGGYGVEVSVCDENYVYGIDADGWLYKLTKDLVNVTRVKIGTSTYPYGMVILGNYLYIAERNDAGTNSNVWKYATSGLTYITKSADYGGILQTICTDGTYIYAGGNTLKKLNKYNTSLSLVSQSADLGATIYSATYYDSYLFVGTSAKLYKLDAAFSTSTSRTIPNGITSIFGNDTAYTPLVTTTAISNINYTTATGGGNVTDSGDTTVTARGICWKAGSTPTISDAHTVDGSGLGSFTSYMTGLTTGTTYNVRAYATNTAGTSYGSVEIFQSIAPTAPTVTTTALSSIGYTTATGGGNVTSGGTETVTNRGICWSTSTNPTTGDTHTSNGTGTGAFTSSLTGLSSNTVYHVRAYAKNLIGLSYGNDVNFTTASYPALNSGTIASSQSIVSGTQPAQLTTTVSPSGGDGSYTLQWLSGTTSTPNSIIVGANSSTYQPPTLSQKTYYRKRVISYYTGYTNVLTITVLPTFYAGTIGTAQTVCNGFNPNLLTTTSSPTGGTGSYTYQWLSGSTNTPNIVIAGATSTTYQPPNLYSQTYYRKKVVSGTETQYTNVLLMNIYPALYAGTIGNPQTIPINTAPAQLTTVISPSGSSGYYTYQWQLSTTGSGGTYSNVPSLGYMTHYQPPSLSVDTWYRKRTYDNNCFVQAYTPPVKITINAPLAPTGLTATNKTCQGWQLNWTNRGTLSDNIEVWWLNLSIATWVKFGTYASTTTHMTFTGMTYNQGGLGSTNVRVINKYNGLQYTALLTGCNTAQPTAPTNLTGTTTGCTSVLLQWTNSQCTGIIHVERQGISGSTEIAVLTHGESQYLVTGLTNPITVSYQIINEYLSNFYASSPFTWSTPIGCQINVPFCQYPNSYSVVNSTCMNMDGLIIINDMVHWNTYYTFKLTDVFGTVYPLWFDRYYVTAGWYFLEADVKPQYASQFGFDKCTISHIKVIDSNSTITINKVTVKPLINSYLLSAGDSNGRVYVKYTDSDPHLHDYYLFDQNNTLVYHLDTTSQDFIVDNLPNGTYYGIIMNIYSNCHGIPDVITVKNQNNPYNLSGVKQVFLTPYSTNISWTNWKTSDEDYYIQGIDPLTFAGTKIKSYSGITTWYKLPTNYDTTYSSPIEKNRQGFMYTHTLTLTFGQSDYTKWQQLYQLLLYTNRYIIVFEDNNGFWWTFGYQNVGGRTYVYQQVMETNTFMIQIKFYSANILTALDENYVNTHILN